MKDAPSQRAVLISGANGGIGTAVALELMSDEYRLSLGARSAHTDPTIQAAIESKRVHSSIFDAQTEGHAEDWVDSALSRYGRIDAVVNCIGIYTNYTFTDRSFDELDKAIDVNVKAPIRIIRAVYPHLVVAENPKIINVVSLSGFRVLGKSAGYPMSKFALRALGHSVRWSGWEHKIRVTNLCPGWVNTKMAEGRSKLAPEEMTQPQDIAKIVRLLLELPPTCSIADLAVNCILDPYF